MDQNFKKTYLTLETHKWTKFANFERKCMHLFPENKILSVLEVTHPNVHSGWLTSRQRWVEPMPGIVS